MKRKQSPKAGKALPAKKPSEHRDPPGKAAASRARSHAARATRSSASRADEPGLHSVTEKFEQLLKSVAANDERYVLRLYVTGTTPRSTRAVQNIRSLCDRHLEGRYDLEIIDIYQQPRLASGDQIIAAPTLIKELPQPIRKVIGDLSNEQQVLIGLDLVAAQSSISATRSG